MPVAFSNKPSPPAIVKIFFAVPFREVKSILPIALLVPDNLLLLSPNNVTEPNGKPSWCQTFWLLYI